MLWNIILAFQDMLLSKDSMKIADNMVFGQDCLKK